MSLLDNAREQIEALRVIRGVGLKTSLGSLSATLKASRDYGTAPGASVTAAAQSQPHNVAVIDDEGQLTYAELNAQINAVANHLSDLGIGVGDGIAIFCRNTRWFIIADAAATKLGARSLYLNTGFAGPQFAEVCDREGAKAVIYDHEFAPVVDPNAGDRLLVVAHGGERSDPTSLASMVANTRRDEPSPPEAHGRQIILTSGTTGTPKGANRAQPSPSLVTLAMMFSRIPYRAGMRFMLAAPMFHAWGLANWTVAAGIQGTVVLQRRFDPEQTLAAVDEHRCDALVAVPVMLQRIMRLDDEVASRYSTASLQIVPSSGSALPGSQALEWMDRFGDNLYNIYGSTEVALASVATPEDLRAAPGTAGKPPLGVTVALYDDDDRLIEQPGVTGRIFVGNRVQFEGYTGGGDKQVIDGLMSIGDLGHWDEHGRLFVGGRDDDMIVSGGENVFPREVEDLLADHPSIVEAAVIGVDDAEFGQRLAAFVVPARGAEVTADAVRAYVKEHLATYKVPRDVAIVDELPRNASGKILKRELRLSAP